MNHSAQYAEAVQNFDALIAAAILSAGAVLGLLAFAALLQRKCKPRPTKVTAMNVDQC
jgi:hypothetical protein